MPEKELESFLIRLEVILLVKKQMKLEKNFIKRNLYIIFLKEKEQEGSLTNRQKRVLKNIDRYLKNFKKDLEKLRKYSITYGLDYLFNEVDEADYYESKEVKSAFNGNYVLYESKGDKVIN